MSQELIDLTTGEFEHRSKDVTLLPVPEPRAAEPVAADSDSVRLLETGGLFDTLNDAIAAAATASLDTFTLEIIGNVEDTGDVVISSNITIVAAEGSHITTAAAGEILVQDGGVLTLGNGTDTEMLTILQRVRVTDGSVNMQNGVTLKGSADALTLRGQSAAGTISGGIINGDYTAIDVSGGATITEISGGVFSRSHSERS